VAVQHGGSLDVASELGVGSVFTLRLPLRQSSR
jgi:signal transduction histidine kinase